MEWRQYRPAAVTVLKRMALLYVVLVVGFGGISYSSMGMSFIVPVAQKLGLLALILIPVGIFIEHKSRTCRSVNPQHKGGTP